MKNNYYNTINLIESSGKLNSFFVKKDEIVVLKNNGDKIVQISSDSNSKGLFFDVGILHPGENSSPIFFNLINNITKIHYGCGLDSSLRGEINIISGECPHTHSDHGNHGDNVDHGGHSDHDHGRHEDHFHGFITNGAKGDCIYMTHTPIFGDVNHHYQIILQASFKDPKLIKKYEELRNSSYGNNKVQLLFEHIELSKIENREITSMKINSFRYYPDVPTIRDGLVMENVKTELHEFKDAEIIIEKVLHFRTFTPDMPYAEYLEYLLYGNESEVFMDSFISRAPNYHSVAALREVPSFWTKKYFNNTCKIQLLSKKIIQCEPKTISRVAFLNNQTHLIWGMPSGSIGPIDPLYRDIYKLNINAFAVKKYKESESLNELDEEQFSIVIDKLLHFDATNLLNEGLGL